MDTTDLFGVQFVVNKNFKPRLVEDFERWKTEKQWFLANERNERAIVERVLKKHRHDHPDDNRAAEEISTELWETLKKDVDRKDWEKVFTEVLGDEKELPDYDGAPYIYLHDVKELFYEYNCYHYYFTETALDECEKEPIGDASELHWLKLSSNIKRQINFGNNNFIRYQKVGNHIIALAATFTRRQEQSYLQHTFFSIDLNKKLELFDQLSDPVAALLKSACEKDNGNSEAFEMRSRELLYKMINFLDLAPLKELPLPAGKQLDTTSSYQVNNQGSFPMTWVTANWNVSLYIEATTVRGHYKDVLYGKNWSLSKNIYVASHPRKGYYVNAQRIREAENLR